MSRVSLLAAALLPSLAFLFAGYQRRWAGDDGFINTRVVLQLLHGNGPVFNAGERVEAVTSAGWVFVLWLAAALGFDVDTAGCVLSLSLSFVGLLLASLAAARISQPDDARAQTLVMPLGAIAYAAIPVAWDYETSLLENGLGLAFLGTMYWLMSRVVTSSTPVQTVRLVGVAAFIGLSPLVRPDFALYAAPMVLILLFCARSMRARLGIVLAAGLFGGAYQIFRMGYYACLVPNTAIAKEAFAARWDQGFLYLDNTLGAYQLYYPLLLALAGLAFLLRGLLVQRLWLRAALPAALALSGLLHLFYVVRLGGDFMHGRMLLPGLFALFTSVSVLRVSVDAPRARAAVASAALAMVLWASVCACALRPANFEHDILDERAWWSETSHHENPTQLAHYQKHMFYDGPMHIKRMFAAGCPAGLDSLANDSRDVCTKVGWADPLDGKLSDQIDDTLMPLAERSVAPQVVAVYAFRPIGISGRMMGLRVSLTDSFGLADPLASRMELLKRGRPGHEKLFDTVWWAAKYAAPGATLDPRVRLARKALGCGELLVLQHATRAPLTFDRFVENLSLAVTLHDVRVPTDPQAAVDRYCGL